MHISPRFGRGSGLKRFDSVEKLPKLYNELRISPLLRLWARSDAKGLNFGTSDLSSCVYVTYIH